VFENYTTDNGSAWKWGYRDILNMRYKETCDSRVVSARRLFLDLQELDVKDEVAVAWDAWGAFATVCEVGRDGESTLATNLQAGNTNIPTLDDFSNTELE
jgi:hypothetical protein